MLPGAFIPLAESSGLIRDMTHDLMRRVCAEAGSAIGTDRNSTTIVETLVDLAHNMRMDVVAEGVENFEQVMHLRELGIRSEQGYVFAPALPGSAFLRLIETIDPLPKAAEQNVVMAGSRFSAA